MRHLKYYSSYQSVGLILSSAKVPNNIYIYILVVHYLTFIYIYIYKCSYYIPSPPGPLLAWSLAAAGALRAAGEPGDGHLFAAALHLGGAQALESATEELGVQRGKWWFHRGK